MKVTKADMARLDALIGEELDRLTVFGEAVFFSVFESIIERALRNEGNHSRVPDTKVLVDALATARKNVPGWSAERIAATLRAMGWRTFIRNSASPYWHKPWSDA